MTEWWEGARGSRGAGREYEFRISCRFFFFLWRATPTNGESETREPPKDFSRTALLFPKSRVAPPSEGGFSCGNNHTAETSEDNRLELPALAEVQRPTEHIKSERSGKNEPSTPQRSKRLNGRSKLKVDSCQHVCIDETFQGLLL